MGYETVAVISGDTSMAMTGNVGKEPEFRFTQSGKALLNIRVAVQNYMGPNVDKFTTWYDITLWEKEAENLKGSLKKGDRISFIAERIEITKGDQGGIFLKLKTVPYTTHIIMKTAKAEQTGMDFSSDQSAQGEDLSNIPF